MTFNKRIAAVFCSALMLSCFYQNARAQQAVNNVSPAGYRIFVHTDKEEYLAGELAWFKTYLVEAASNKPVHSNTVIYIELLNNKGKSMLQAKILAAKEHSNGSFYLPADLPTGAYTLVAYTTEMKKAGPGSYFHKKIDVINTLRALPAAALSQKSNTVFTAFYPEGGTIIPGLSTRFGFYVMDPSTRKGLDAQGVIVNQRKDTIAHFNTLAYGMGQVRFTPLEQDKYFALINIDDSSFATGISLPQRSDYLLAAEPTDNGIRITALYKTQSAANDRKKMRLVMHARQKTKSGVEITLENGKPFEYFIEKSKLGTGVTYFTLFNNQDQPVCERLLFIPPSTTPAQVTIGVNATTAGKREAFQMGLQYNGNADDSINGSIAIVPATAAGTDKISSIYEYLLLGADVPGNIEDPAFYFSDKALANPAYLDNLMLVNGWRKFSTSSENSTVNVMPEYHGHIISARVLDSWTNTGKAKVLCTLSAPSYPFGFYTAMSDSNGIVRFEVQNYFGPGSIVVKAMSNVKPNPYKIEILEPFDERLSTDSSGQSFTASLRDSASLAKRSLAMQVLNTYRHDELNRFIPPAMNDSFAFFGKAEFSYELDNYTRFSTMEEVLREYVTPIGVNIRDSKLTMSIYNEKERVFYNDFMLVLLDGVPLSNPHEIFNYDPYKVKKIEIVPRRYLYGANQYYGIASFETYRGQFDAVELDPTAVLVDYEGLQLKREFYSPAYTTTDKGDLRVPDLRTTLLWIPDIDLAGNSAATINGYTSDLAGAYHIIFCGLSATGIPTQQIASFEVK